MLTIKSYFVNFLLALLSLRPSAPLLLSSKPARPAWIGVILFFTLAILSRNVRWRAASEGSFQILLLPGLEWRNHTPCHEVTLCIKLNLLGSYNAVKPSLSALFRAAQLRIVRIKMLKVYFTVTGAKEVNLTK